MSKYILDGYYERFGGRYPASKSFEIISDESEKNMEEYINQIIGGDYGFSDNYSGDLDQYMNDFAYERYSGGSSGESASTVNKRLKELFRGIECTPGDIPEITGHYTIKKKNTNIPDKKAIKNDLAEFITGGENSGCIEYTPESSSGLYVTGGSAGETADELADETVISDELSDFIL